MTYLPSTVYAQNEGRYKSGKMSPHELNSDEEHDDQQPDGVSYSFDLQMEFLMQLPFLQVYPSKQLTIAHLSTVRSGMQIPFLHLNPKRQPLVHYLTY